MDDAEGDCALDVGVGYVAGEDGGKGGWVAVAEGTGFGCGCGFPGWVVGEVGGAVGVDVVDATRFGSLLGCALSKTTEDSVGGGQVVAQGAPDDDVVLSGGGAYGGCVVERGDFVHGEVEGGGEVCGAGSSRVRTEISMSLRAGSQEPDWMDERTWERIEPPMYPVTPVIRSLVGAMFAESCFAVQGFSSDMKGDPAGPGIATGVPAIYIGWRAKT